MENQKQKITSEVAARIKYFRCMRAISQEEAALRADINPAYFGQVERGLKCPTIDTLCRIAKALDVSPAAFLQMDTPKEGTGYNLRIQELLSRVPSDKIEQVFKILEDAVGLL